MIASDMIEIKKSIAILVVAASLRLAAQSLNDFERRMPSTTSEKLDVPAAAPRLNGKPDLSGVWQAERTWPLSICACWEKTAQNFRSI